ncbi:nicotinate-nucleotide adenylyltransferase [Palleronia aestuarii]|uniref:Probable nicotinate-nucleotide adenylyltransferase n=1 Tax=Palleronia aestuarii TaxID=568105 RepID=A0A2W7Q095_9RHOB|nr:nicotinate-nucleotide adenylyltransferase [Palleronia aestuarii]PZX15199.1 nicotinate-nucleotide adenylyltransferase [Palleronia aestuarii]
MHGPGWPVARSGEVIGLLGGSFDPAHAGHAHVTREALRLFGLDRVWWLVSPGNPLKKQGPAPLDRRLARAREVMDHPRAEVTALETALGTRYTADTIRALQRRYPGVRFVWLMGADNLASLHLWDDWQEIVNRVPVGVLARPGQRISARMSPAARLFARARLRGGAVRGLGRMPPPAWAFVNIPMRADNSSALRAAGEWTVSVPA